MPQLLNTATSIAASSAGITQGPAAAQPAARPLDAMEFSNLLNQTPATGAAPPVAAPTKAGGLGSAMPVVEGIQNASNHLKNRMSSIKEMTSRANFTGGAADLLRMQLEMVQLGFEIELTGKVVTRATQDIDQLSKLQ